LTKKVVLAALLALMALGNSAFAKRIPIGARNQGWMQRWCGNTGVFWPEGGTSSTFGCMKPDGSGMVCSGVSPRDKKTCDTFRTIPPRLFDHFKDLSAGENRAEKQ